MLEKIKSKFVKSATDRYIGLCLESSALCNLRCPHCVLRTYEKELKRSHMSPDTVRAVMPYMGRLEEIDLTGWGEPLINPAFYENLKLIRSAFSGRISFTTNGTLLDESGMERLIDADVSSICFSIDAADEEQYKRLRPGGDFQGLVSTLKKLTAIREESGKKQPHLFATYLLRRDTLDSLPGFVEWIRDLGFDGVVLQQMTGVFTEQDRCQVTYTNYFQTDFNSTELSETLARARKFGRDGFSVLMPELVYPDKVGGCNAFNILKPFISAAGDVTVCCVMAYPTKMMLRDGRVERRKVVTFGNVNREPLDKIWSKPAYARLRKTMYEKGSPGECGDCIGLYLVITGSQR